MSWRIPSMQAGTTLLSNDLPVTLFSDNSLSGPLNWIYSAPGKMDHILYFTTVRTQEGRALGNGLQPGIKFQQNYLATVFSGDTDKVVVINFLPPGCFRVLDPEIDPLNKLLEPTLRDAASLSKPGMILSNPPAQLPEFYQPEISHNWCYDYAQAELSRQRGEWEKIVEIHDSAVKQGEHFNDPLENFVFIEADAHTGNWENARQLTRETYKYSKEYMRPTLCKLWDRIERDLPDSPKKQNTLTAVRGDLSCGK